MRWISHVPCLSRGLVGLLEEADFSGNASASFLSIFFSFLFTCPERPTWSIHVHSFVVTWTPTLYFISPLYHRISSLSQTHLVDESALNRPKHDPKLERASTLWLVFLSNCRALFCQITKSCRLTQLYLRLLYLSSWITVSRYSNERKQMWAN